MDFKNYFTGVEQYKIKASVRGSGIKKKASEGYAYIAPNGQKKHLIMIYNCTLVTDKYVRDALGLGTKQAFRCYITPSHWAELRKLALDANACKYAHIQVAKNLVDYIDDNIKDYLEQ